MSFTPLSLLSVLRETLYWFSPTLSVRLDVFCIGYYIAWGVELISVFKSLMQLYHGVRATQKILHNLKTPTLIPPSKKETYYSSSPTRPLNFNPLPAYSLPWDPAIPVIGTSLVELLRGSASVGQFILTCFYSLHTFVLPLLAIVFMLMHFPMTRKQGISGLL